MGRESASCYLSVPPVLENAVLVALGEEREIAKIEEMWEGEPQLPPEHPDSPSQNG